MGTIQEALRILEKDKINNAGFINFVKNNLILSIDILGKSVLCRGVSDRKWIYICCNEKDELYQLKDNLNADDSNYAVIDEWMMPILTEGRELIWDLAVMQYYLPNEVGIKPNKEKTVQLTEKDVSIVYENSTYQNYISIDYVKQRIKKGISVGLYEGNKLVSWSITQDDGAIGFLHTIKAYRGKGYGKEVISSMIEKIRAIGQIPFAYVEESNNESKNMILKLGFIENKKIHWFQIK